MALVKALLKANIKAMIVTKPSNAAVAAIDWGLAYDGYALPAMAGAFPGVFTGSEKTRFSTALTSLFASPSTGTPVLAATAFMNALTGYWLTPPVAFGAGVVSVITGLSAISSLFTTLFTDPDAAADHIATILDTATKTVTVAFTGPPSTVTLT